MFLARDVLVLQIKCAALKKMMREEKGGKELYCRFLGEGNTLIILQKRLMYVPNSPCIH